MKMPHKTKQYNYFETFCTMALETDTAALYLKNAIDDSDKNSINSYISKANALKNQSEKKLSDILKKLRHEFITPIEREDIALITQMLFNATKSIIMALNSMYMFDICHKNTALKEFSIIISDCTGALINITKQLEKYKSSKTLDSAFLQMRNIQDRAENHFIQCVHTLFSQNKAYASRLELIYIYKSFKNCTEQCSKAADAINIVVIKNC